MKRLIQLLAIVSVAGGVALLSGCQKEGWGGKGSLKEVSFGATAHSSVDTRTEYMGYNGGANENIKWVDNDKIRIYSPDAARRVAVEAGEAPENCYYWADYQVVPISSNPTKGTLKNSNTDGYDSYPSHPGYIPGDDPSYVSNGLVWLGESATFYGVYPVPAGQNGKGPDVASGKVTFGIPSSQSFSTKGNMRDAYMTAKTTANQGESVSLNFYPDFTAFEISLKSEDQSSQVTLNSFTLGSAGNDIMAGDYTIDLSGANKTYDFTGASDKAITAVNRTGSPVVIPSETDSPLVFTVFALPSDMEKLYLQFNTTTDGVDRTLTLHLKKNNQYITFGACKKHRIYGLLLPTDEWKITYAEEGMEVEEWIVSNDNDQTFVIE